MMPDHIQYIINNYSDQLEQRLQEENRKITIDCAMNTLLTCDPSQGKKLVDWLVKTYIVKGFRWEDVEAGLDSKLAEVLGHYQTHFNQIPRGQRNIYLYQSYGELYGLIESYLTKRLDEETLGSREIKRRERAQALEESEVLYRSEECIIAIPLTQNAAVWWGRGTKWCTAAEKNNYFHHYNQKAPLIVITLMNSGFSLMKHDCSGKGAQKFQLWVNGEDIQFMDSSDCSVDIARIEENWPNFERVIVSMIAENAGLIKLVPYNLRTAELCNLAFEKDKAVIKHFPCEIITYDMCIKTVEEIPQGIFCINKSLKTLELCELAIEKDAMALCHIPPQYLSRELCRGAVENNGAAIEFVPEQYQTPEICMQAVKTDGLLIRYVGKAFKTPELCMIAIEQNRISVHFVPKHFLTYDHYKNIIEKNGFLLNAAPDSLITAELARLAVEQNGKALSSVPQRFKTLELCQRAIEQNGLAIVYVPSEFLSAKLYKQAVDQNGLAIEFVHKEYRTPEICWRAVEQRAFLLCYVPEKYRTPELCLLAVQQDSYALRYVPTKSGTYEIYKRAVQQTGKALEYIPENFMDEEICLLAINNDIEAVQWMPTNMITPEIAELVRSKGVDWDQSIIERIKSNLNAFDLSSVNLSVQRLK